MNENQYEKISIILPDVLKKAKINQVNKGYPIKKDRVEINKIILEHIINYKRIIKGGKAHDYWLKKKGQEIYADESYGDYDFISPDPILDLKEICNKLYKEGYEDVFGTQGLTENVFSVKVFNEAFCDIMYVSKDVMEKKIIYDREKNVNYLNYKYCLYDLYYIMSEPLYKYQGYLEKIVKRLFLFTKFYPEIFKKPKKIIEKSNNNFISVMKNKILTQYIYNNENVLLSDFEAYKLYKDVSGFEGYYYTPNKNEELVIIVKDIKSCLKKIFNLFDERLKINEYYSYISKLDRSVSLEYKNKKLIRIYGNNNTCIQYNKFQLDNNIDTVNVVSFNNLMSYFLVMSMYYKKKSNIQLKYLNSFYYLHVFHKKYLNKNNLIGYEDDNPFNYFNLNCIGEKKSIHQLRMLYFNKRSEKRLKRKFEYRPKNTLQEKIIINFPYLNNSGELIKDSKYKIFGKQNNG